MKLAILIISSVSCVASLGTLAVVLMGAKQVHEEMEEVKTKTQNAVNKFKAAVADLEI